MKKSLSWLLCSGILLASLTLSGQPVLAASETASLDKAPSPSRIAVMPFIVGRHSADIDDTLAKTLDCAVYQLCYALTDIQTGAEETLTRFAHQALMEKYQGRLLPLDVVKAAYDDLEQDPMTDTPRSIARKLGTAVDAEFVLVGAVWRYRERTGSAAVSDQPASVSFAVFLVKTESGEQVWKATFDKTQRALSDNILEAPMFFKKGLKWLTAEDRKSVV